MMSPLLVNPRCLLIVNIIILLCGIWQQNGLCQAVVRKGFKDMLIITAENITENTTFPSEVIYHNESQIKLCFNILANKTNADCCHEEPFNCTTRVNWISNDKYILKVKLSTLIQHDIVVLQNPTYNFSCRPSKFYKSGLILQIHNCLKGGGKNIRLSLYDTLGENVVLKNMTHDGYEYLIDCEVYPKNVTCKPVQNGSSSTTTPISPTTTISTTISTTTPITTTTPISPTTTISTTTPISTTTTTPITTITSISTTTPITTITSVSTTILTTTPITTTTTTKTTTIFTARTTTDMTTTQEVGQLSITVNISKSPASPEQAVNILNNLTSLVEKLGNSSTAAIKIGNITGVIAKLPAQNATNLNFGFTASGDVKTFKEQNGLGLSRRIKIPKEASEMAVNRSSKFAAVLLFPEMTQTPLGENNSFFFNNEILGIEMGAQISNLTDTVDIQFNNVNKNGNSASCRSWDGKAAGNSPAWVPDGCQTVETNDTITCRCSHLTFFAILMSPIPTNISAADANNLNQITQVGCGVSIFFLGVALFMHFLLRKNKASDAAKVLVNLFIALFFLNFSFLINKTIAGLKNWAACVAMAAFLHYSMLATFTWFSMQALHLYLGLHKVPANIKHYMVKLYVTGWVTPAVFVIVLLGLNKYKTIVISYDDGTTEEMCWMSDSAVHFGVNIVYYAIVFIFTLIIFVVTVVKIVHFGTKATKTQDGSSIKSKLFSILGLFFLLGISWAFAFFSYGPLLIPSYYIFTILNSFQGFLLFLYYYYSTKIVPESKKVPQNSNSTVNENIYTKSPYG